MAEDQKKYWIDMIGLILVIAGLLTTGSIYVSSRPNREEVKQIVDEKVNFRLGNLEQKITTLEGKIDELLRERRQ